MLGQRQLGRRRQRDGVRHVLRSGPAAAVLRAAEEQRLERRAAADVHRADSLGRADLMATDREEVEWRLARVHLDLPARPHGVRVEYRAAGLRERRDRKSTRLNSSHLGISYA